MYCRSINWLICMFTAVSLATCYRNTGSTKEWSVAESVREVRQEVGEELAALLDAGADAVVTLEAGGTRLVAHRAVLAARSPALAALLDHYSVKAGDQLTLPGVEGPVLRHLVAYLYTLRTPRLSPGTATQLLAAAHRFGLPALQADCERQVAAQLSVETAASVAVLAVELSLTDLRDAAINFIKDHRIKVLATKGWADALEHLPKEAAEVSRLLADRLAEICAPATMGAGTTTTMQAETTTNMETETTTTTMEAATTTNTDAGTTNTTQPHSDTSQTPATAAPPLAACPTSPLDEATVSHLRSLSQEERGDRLLQAAKRGVVGEVRALLAAGAKVDARDLTGWTALHHAASEGHAQAASCLLGARALVNARQRWQYTPLHLAIIDGHTSVVRLLLAAGADPDARDDNWMRPLHWAAVYGDAEVVAALLEAGADKGARDADGRTPLDVARRNNHPQLFEMLTKR